MDLDKFYLPICAPLIVLIAISKVKLKRAFVSCNMCQVIDQDEHGQIPL